MTRKKIIEELCDSKEGFLKTYKRLQVGDASWAVFVLFEMVTTLIKYVPGALGLLLRSYLYRPFFANIGHGVVFGCGVTLRNPGRIRLGDHVIVDDHAVLDAKGDSPDGGIFIGDRVFVSRNAILACKNGTITLGSNISIGPHCTIHSVEGSHVRVGDYVMLAAYCYLVGAPNYRSERTDIPMMQQGFEAGRGIALERDTWLGAYAAVLDGSRIGEGAIVGAKSLVRGEIEPYAFVVGIPAVKKHSRKHEP